MPIKDAREAWLRMSEAAQSYGKTWRACSQSRLHLIDVRMTNDRLSVEDLVCIVHGAMTYWSGAGASADFEPLRHLVIETLLRPSNWPKYLDAYVEPSAKPKTLDDIKADYFRKQRERETSDECNLKVVRGGKHSDE